MTSTVDHNLPLYGMTREQVIALGQDPDVVEAGRLAAIEGRQQQRRQDEAGILVAAQEAVATGELTWAEAAAALNAGGFPAAHALLVEQWQADEAELARYEAADELAIMDVNEYAEHFAQQQARERAELDADVENINRQLRQKQVEALQADLKSFVESTPGAHALAPDLEARIVRNLQTSGELPTTPEERAAVIQGALKETAVIGNATEALQQQVDTEWRLHRKAEGGRGDLMTAGDIARAEEAFKSARLQQLSDNAMINLDELKPSPSAEQESAAIVERYRERQAKSDDLHRDVAGMVARAKEAEVKNGPGSGFLDDQAAYREAVARAESEAQYGTVNTTLTEPAATAKPGGYGPDGTWPDELGPAL